MVLAFLAVQACDGVLTYIGMSTFGPHMEGNPIVSSLMVAFGVGPGLTGAKVVAGMFGILLHVSGVHRLMALLTALYLVLAVVPWTALLMLG
ncbi:MAG: hypothetical protein EHM24_07480 [Acidobacteria bacterium]|nr:MAG: hypothetical protein EHM24_07480 [Acidobacteriota bacterium]